MRRRIDNQISPSAVAPGEYFRSCSPGRGCNRTAWRGVSFPPCRASRAVDIVGVGKAPPVLPKLCLAQARPAPTTILPFRCAAPAVPWFLPNRLPCFFEED